MPLRKDKHEEVYLRDGRAPVPEKESTSRIMRANRGKNTKPELLVRSVLWNAGIRSYRLHWKIPGRPDIAFPRRRIAIFIHGCYWHRCPYCQLPNPKSNSEFWIKKFERNIERDKKKLELLDEQGWTCLVLWECKIRKDLPGIVAKIRELLTQMFD